MKKTIAAVALILTAVFAVSCSGKKSDVPDGMKLASDPKSASYTLYVPEDWTVDVQNSSTRAYCSKEDRSSVMVMTGETENTDTPVRDWWESGLSELKALYPDFELVTEGEKVKFGGADAEKYVYSGTFDGTKFKYTQVAAVKRGVIYVLTYGAPEDKWESHVGEVEKIIENFSFSK
ncbi:MAG: hypothetical protein IKR53_05245 [Clostridia bacterium]|nr:hypothetical protein [Clostridia bacterium]MBR6290832.1 hypothetical protein [Clostridia bacterium]